MTKYLSLVSTWVILIAVVFGFRVAGRMRADPTDDFSFTLAQRPGHDHYHFMSEGRVTEILEDRLEGLPKSEAPKLAQHLLDLSKRHHFDPAFLLSLMQVESGFHVRIISPSGAVGLMQVMPGTAAVMVRDMGIDLGLDPSVASVRRILLDPYVNLTFGVAYLSWLRDRYRGLSAYYLVAAYNLGPARMDELLARKSFRPVMTKRYFEAIRRGIPEFRFYRREA